MFLLRQYQTDLLDRTRAALKQDRRVLMQSPTGTGKTVMFCHLVDRVRERGKRAVIVVHRRELLTQASDKLTENGIRHGRIMAGMPRDAEAPVQVASIQTLARRGLPWTPDLIVLDESHHATSRTYLDFLAKYPRAYVLGVTATPARLDGRGLGHVFGSLVLGATIRDLQQQQFLAELDVYAPPGYATQGVKRTAGDFNKGELNTKVLAQRGVTGDAVKHYQQHGGGRQFIAFTVSVQHAHDTAATFNDAGIACRAIDGTMAHGERDGIVRDYRRGSLRGLVSCDIISEGFDVPEAAVCIALRPTMSLNLFMQQCGRVMRPKADGSKAVILDHAGNVLRHGLPDQDREWTLTAGVVKPAKPKAPAIKQCKQCYAVAPAYLRACPQCHAEFAHDGRAVSVSDGVLERVERINLADLVAQRHDALERAKRVTTLAELHQIAREVGYKPGWAFAYWKRKREWAGKRAATG